MNILPNWVSCPDDWELYEEDMLEINRFYYDNWIESIESAEQIA